MDNRDDVIPVDKFFIIEALLRYIEVPTVLMTHRV